MSHQGVLVCHSLWSIKRASACVRVELLLHRTSPTVATGGKFGSHSGGFTRTKETARQAPQSVRRGQRQPAWNVPRGFKFGSRRFLTRQPDGHGFKSRRRIASAHDGRTWIKSRASSVCHQGLTLDTTESIRVDPNRQLREGLRISLRSTSGLAWKITRRLRGDESETAFLGRNSCNERLHARSAKRSTGRRNVGGGNLRRKLHGMVLDGSRETICREAARRNNSARRSRRRTAGQAPASSVKKKKKITSSNQKSSHRSSG